MALRDEREWSRLRDLFDIATGDCRIEYVRLLNRLGKDNVPSSIGMDEGTAIRVVNNAIHNIVSVAPPARDAWLRLAAYALGRVVAIDRLNGYVAVPFDQAGVES